jgi:cardiolipin synthase A/B
MSWAIVIALIHVAGLLTALRAVMDVRTSQGAIAWAVALITFPYVSLPAYLIFGRNKFRGYTVRRRNAFFKTNPVARKCAAQLLERGLLAVPERNRAFLVERLVSLPFTTQNHAELLIDGEATFRSIFAGIDEAREYVLVEFYILRDDAIGRELQERLITKARHGVAVRVLFDEIGSKELSENYREELTAAGVAIHPFNTRQGPSNRWQLNFRNHRKIVVVDGHSAWVGGLNVGDEYLGRDPKVGAWRDTHVKLTGPSVAGAQITFLEDWNWATHELLPLRWEMEPAPSDAQCTALFVPSGPADTLETCTLFFLHAINSAKQRLWIASPYFVPDEQFISALQLAALRGVDVRVLIPHKSDNKLVQLSIWSYVAELEAVGVRMFQHRQGFMHQKVMLVDDHFATIGTANFDNRSFRLNFEITVAVVDEEFAARVRQMLEDDFAGSKLITTAELASRGWWFRLSSRIARLMAPVQ